MLFTAELCNAHNSFSFLIQPFVFPETTVGLFYVLFLCVIHNDCLHLLSEISDTLSVSPPEGMPPGAF